MATYNGANYIKEQIDSILVQLGVSDELIISDDGSTDDTILMIQNINDSRIKIIFNQNESGYTGNFENALKNAAGDIIFLADQDDIWVPNKVEIAINILNEADFVVSDAKVVNSNLKLINKSYFRLRNAKPGFVNNLIRCRYLGCCYAFRKKVLDKALPFPKKHKMLPHDLWLALIAEFYFKVAFLDVPLVIYRRHTFNASDGGSSSSNSFYFQLKMRLYSIYHIIRVF